MNGIEDDLRYVPWFGVQYRNRANSLQSWYTAWLGVDQDEGRQRFHREVMQSAGYYDWRFVSCGPPQYNYIVRAVIDYQEGAIDD